MLSFQPSSLWPGGNTLAIQEIFLHETEFLPWQLNINGGLKKRLLLVMETWGSICWVGETD